MALRFPPKISKKLKLKHNVTEDEVQECFNNREGNLLEDTREEHKTDPRTLWFIAETNKRRKLKVCFVEGTDSEPEIIKSAFEPNEQEISIYKKYG